MGNFIEQVYISLNDLELHFGENIILNKTSLSIHKGDKIGLVGRNGSGKSTFLKIIVDQMSPDNGKIDRKKNLRIGYLSQNFDLDENKTIYENILSGAKEVFNLIKKHNSLPEDSLEKHEIHEKIDRLHGWNIDGEIDKLINRLNVREKNLIIKDLSGGEKRRVSLCKALISRPELLVLDEPTNHLDTESIAWLEGFLQKYNGACIFVTHDRYFLDNISNRIVELSRGTFHNHNGNYTDYLISKAQRHETEVASEKNRQKFLNRELEWVRKGPKGRMAKNEGRVDRYHREASKDTLEKELDIELIIPPAPKLSNRILDIKNLSYKIKDRILFENLNLEFKEKMRLGIIGRNGLGKSTLLKIILGQIQGATGTVDIASRTQINYVDQDKLVPNDENTVYKEIGEGRDMIQFGDKIIPLKTYLKRFLFNHKRMFAQIKNLSGGERSRLMLAKILKNGGNFLILDEPTNDLDLNTLRILEEGLENFAGCVIVVSHDRYFLNRVCTDILAFEGDGKVVLSSGDYDFYIKKKSGKTYENDDTEKTSPKAKQRSKITREELQELRKVERQISTLEEKVKSIEMKFMDPAFHMKPLEEITKVTNELNEVKDKIKELYEEWEELESKR